MNNLQLIVTGDGSHSLLNKALDETYHSRHGAVQESQYVFINRGFDFFVERNSATSLSILEVGFGTGLNAWLSQQRATALGIQVHYTSLETFPLSAALWASLNFTTESDEKKIFEKLHEVEWNREVIINPCFCLQKVEESFQHFEPSNKRFDLIYFDAFAPNKQPELWEMAVLQKVYSMMAENGVFVTYCAKGQLKRDLSTIGLCVESLPGPPGKREMVRAIKSR
jgi:tRNA U34 5-methylaminomethyl-2-thiouridine-forming methyltransferase MnmC